MNCGSCLLLVLALGASSMNSVAAAHRSHGVHYASSHHHSRTVSRSVETSRTPAVVPRDSSSETKSIAPDQSKGSARDGSRVAGTDRANGDDESRYTRKSGVSTQDPAPHGKADADVAIDTRITVNQGRETIRGLGKRQLRSSNVNVATGIGLKRQHVVDRHQATPMRSPGDRRRNSIGAVMNHDKAATEHRNAAGAAVISPTTAGPEPKANPAPLATGTTVRTPNAVSPAGNAPVNNSSPVANQVNRGNTAAAVTAATTNGPSINGTGMIRPASRMAAIGGPAKVAPGVLSGNGFRPRRP
jgi:hypothetical protein